MMYIVSLDMLEQAINVQYLSLTHMNILMLNQGLCFFTKIIS